MKKLLPVMILVLYASQLYATNIIDTCIDKNIAQEANYHLHVDPITTKIILSSIADCDEKCALMHKANVKIANKCRMEFYYQDAINQHGWYDNQTPNIYEKHVMANPDQFNPAREGTYKITASDYWLKKIKNRNHPIFADFEYQEIKLFYDGVWEDSDGSWHSVKLIKRFNDWINRYPKHSKVPETQDLIERMKNYHIKLIKDLAEWVKTHPKHEKVGRTQERIKHLKNEMDLVNNL